MGAGFRLALALTTFVMLIGVSTLCYVVIEDMPFLDALYMTVITVTTVGFREVGQLDANGQVLTILVALMGVVLVAIAVGSLTEVLVAGSVQRMLGRRRMEKQIEGLWNHYILCGYGRIGHLIGKDLWAEGVPFVVIERNPENLASAAEDGLLFLEGDATEDDMLLKAGIRRARGLITTLPSDAQNVFVAMSARDLSPKLEILARAEEEAGKRKLLRAGATRVVAPYEIGARRMAHSILRPSVIDFIELVTLSPGEAEMLLGEVLIQPDSDLEEQTLVESEIRAKHQAYVVALKKAGEKMEMNPSPDTRMEAGDVMIVIAPSRDLKRLEERASSGKG
jgi:voltage-gated potassium channel